jgi:signal transduction histidine kinase
MIKATSAALWDFRVSENLDAPYKMWYSPEFLSLLEYPKPTKWTCFDEFNPFIHPDYRDIAFESARIQMIAGRPFVVEYPAKKFDGTYKWIRVYGQVELDKKGNPFRAAGCAMDISTEKEYINTIEQQRNDLEKSLKEVQKQNERLSEFAQIASHNLRAPIANIHILLDYYNMEDDAEYREVLIEKLGQSADRLNETIENLTEFLNINAGLGIEVQKINLETILEKTKKQLSGKMLQTNASIIHDFSTKNEIDFPIVYIESIFLNLLSNAIKYSSPNRNPVIKINTYLDEYGHTCLRFEDNGLGIDLTKHGDIIFKLHKIFN